MLVMLILVQLVRPFPGGSSPGGRSWTTSTQPHHLTFSFADIFFEDFLDIWLKIAHLGGNSGRKRFDFYKVHLVLKQTRTLRDFERLHAQLIFSDLF